MVPRSLPHETECLCGYDLNITYPQHKPFAPINNTIDETDSATPFLDPRKRLAKRKLLKSMLSTKRAVPDSNLAPVDRLKKRNEMKKREEKRQAWKRDLRGRANGTIDPWYGCFLMSEATDYALNFSMPWSELSSARSLQMQLIRCLGCRSISAI